MMKRILLALLAGAVCSSVAAEDGAALTQKILEKTINRGTEVLKDESLDFTGKMDEFEVLLRECCHTDLMAYTVLGKDRWMQLSDQQRTDFIATFIQMVTRTYYSKLKLADVDSVVITYEGNESISPNSRILTAKVRDNTGEYAVQYKFAQVDGRWWVRDLVIEGISLIASYRSEYSDYLQTHSIDDLIAMIREKAAEVEKVIVQPKVDVGSDAQPVKE
jgi:phospholipid transport system substrate-binding protein